MSGGGPDRRKRGAPGAEARGLQFFYATAPRPCPYLPGRVERKAATDLSGPGAPALLDALSRAGFRRNYAVAYRPACAECRACVPVRVVVRDFAWSRSLRRVAARNADLRAEVRPPHATLEQYMLFREYERARHGGEMATMAFRDYREMVEDTPVETQMAEFRDESGRLVAAALVDRLADGLSGVYKFFDPNRARSSPGAWTVLWLVERARALELGYVYLGYWIAESPKMAYKTRFRPLEALAGGRWRPFERGEAPPLSAPGGGSRVSMTEASGGPEK